MQELLARPVPKAEEKVLVQLDTIALEQERSGEGLHVSGFSTPAAAFHQTDYWDRLLER